MIGRDEERVKEMLDGGWEGGKVGRREGEGRARR